MNSETERIAADFLLTFDDSRFPEAFLGAYDILECFSQNEYSETYLVRGRETGRLAVAKCYLGEILPHVQEHALLEKLHHNNLPAYMGSFANDGMLCVLREYVEGTPLNIACKERTFTSEQALSAGIALCNILDYLHTQTPPIIHRDIKPENIILCPDESVALIDFGISRAYRQGAEADTMNFGTKCFSAPEQYGYAQTDHRSDLFSLGMVMGYLLTGSTRMEAFAEIPDKGLRRVIQTCTAFDPADRYANAAACRRALVKLQPKRRTRRRWFTGIGCVLAVAAIVLAAVWMRNRIASDGANGLPAFLTGGAMTAQAARYLNEKYATSLFTADADTAHVGDIRKLLTDVYGYDVAYVNGHSTVMQPTESEDYFLPWGLADDEALLSDVMVYAAVKIYYPDVVADWSSLTDDTGEYPGIRVARAFAEENGIYDNVNQADHMTSGDVALMLYNADRAYGDALPPQLTNVYAPAAKPISPLGFTEPLIEQAARAALGKSETDEVSHEELRSVETLCVFGNAVSADEDGFYAAADDWYAADHRIKGSITSLQDLKLLPNVRVLCLAAQQISDLSPLASLPLLEKVECKHNRISDISVLASLPALASVGVNDNPIADISPLAACKSLRILDLCSVEGYDPSFIDALGDFDFLDISNSTDTYARLGSRSIRQLKLDNTAIDALSYLSDVTGLQSLELKHSKLTSLAGIEAHRELTYLNIVGCAIDDLSPLKVLPALQTLVISEDMRPAAEALGDVRFTVSYAS